MAELVFFTGVTLTLILFIAAVRVFKPKRIVILEYQRGVLFSGGKLEKTIRPGAYWIGFTRSISVIDTRLQVLNVAGQEILTAEGLSLKLTLAGEYKIEDAERYLLTSTAPAVSLYNCAQQALREALAGLSFESILATRNAINTQVLELVTPQATTLGLSLKKIEVRDIILPGDLKRAFAQTLTAQKEGLANLERARSETASLRSLANAARLMQEHPGLLQLRAIQAIETSKGNTITLGLADSREKA